MLRTVRRALIRRRLSILGILLLALALQAACEPAPTSGEPKYCEPGFHLNDHNECVADTP